MRGKWNTLVGAGALTVFLLCRAASAEAQSGQQSQQPSQQQPPADKDKQPNPAPLSMDNAPASPEEDSASKTVQQATDPNKRIQLAEEFLQKYPQSRYRASMYQALVSGYFATQQVPKMLEAGEKEVELNP